jgi:hypothetical protein
MLTKQPRQYGCILLEERNSPPPLVLSSKHKYFDGKLFHRQQQQIESKSFKSPNAFKPTVVVVVGIFLAERGPPASHG